jgi:23S rRNA (uridine2552-2'-O)-methyltransferase
MLAGDSEAHFDHFEVGGQVSRRPTRAARAGGGDGMKKSHSSKQWLRRHVNDPYVQRSKREGYRSRSAYKLAEIDDKDRLLRPGQVVVDLGAAPGGWSQVAARRLGSRGTVVAIDLLEMAPLAGVDFVQGDFTRGSGLKAVQAALGDRKADLVLSDMAPNMSGIPVSDQARSMELAERARDFAVLHLKEEGAFLVKVFQGAGYDEYLKSLRAAFRKVVVRKPDASRDESAEQYLLGRGLKGPKPIDAIGK